METQGFYLTRVPTDERSDRFLLSTSMSSSYIFRALRLVVFPPRVLNRDFTDFFQTLKNLRAVFSRPSPDSPLLHSVLGKVRTTEHPFSERTRSRRKRKKRASGKNFLRRIQGRGNRLRGAAGRHRPGNEKTRRRRAQVREDARESESRLTARGRFSSFPQYRFCPPLFHSLYCL